MLEKIKSIFQYSIPVIAFLIGIIIFMVSPEKSEIYKVVGGKDKNKSIKYIIERENKDNILIEKKNINNIVYFLYEDDGNYKSYFVDRDKDKITDIYSIVKKDKKEEFDNKINYLLELKYPKYVVDAIKTKSTKNYEIRNNELIVYITDLDINTDNIDLSLKVNYNEIKDYIKFDINLDSEYVNESGYDYDPNKKTIAFTYDDGPSYLTPVLLEILAENKAHATFFEVGNRMSSQPDIVKQVYESGNEIGSHTYNHYNMNTTKINKILEKEIITNQNYTNITGDTLTLLRPPYGNVNQNIKNSLDYVFINWNVDTEDWRSRDVEQVKNRILSVVGDGDIILMHDLYESTIEATRQVLPILYEQGYQVVSVSELAKLKGVNLEKHNMYYNIINP